MFESAAGLEEPVVHPPELSLGCGGLDCFDGGPGVSVDLHERESAEDEVHPVSEPPPQSSHGRVGSYRVRAVVVAELDEGDRCPRRAPHAVPPTDRRREIHTPATLRRVSLISTFSHLSPLSSRTT